MGFLVGLTTPSILPTEDTLPGRAEPIMEPQPHAVLGTPITGPWKEGQKSILIGLGCFWGVEHMYWETEGVEATSSGYAGGATPNPTYMEVCMGKTNHAEVVEVTYDPQKVSLRELVIMALESHDPTQGHRQGIDVGTQYRSAFYPRTAEEKAVIDELVEEYGAKLADAGFGDITTEVKLLSDTDAGEYYLAEDEHQQYLHKNPYATCPRNSTGVKCG